MASKQLHRTGTTTTHTQTQPHTDSREQESHAAPVTQTEPPEAKLHDDSTLIAPVALDQTTASILSNTKPVKAGPTSFLDLSRELRDPIYYHAIQNARTQFLCRWNALIFRVVSTPAPEKADSNPNEKDKTEPKTDPPAKVHHGLPLFLLANKQILREGLEEIYHHCQLKIMPLREDLVFPPRRLCHSIHAENFRHVKLHISLLPPLVNPVHTHVRNRHASHAQSGDWILPHVEICNIQLIRVANRVRRSEQWEKFEVELSSMEIPEREVWDTTIPVEVNVRCVLRWEQLTSRLGVYHLGNKLNVKFVRFKVSQEVMEKHPEWAVVLGAFGKHVITDWEDETETKEDCTPGLLEVSRVIRVIYE